jgi:hypothetical protein
MTDVTARAVAVRCRLGGIPRAADVLPGLAHSALRDEAILTESAGPAGLQPPDTERKTGLWPPVRTGPRCLARMTSDVLVSDSGCRGRTAVGSSGAFGPGPATGAAAGPR